MLRHVRWVTGAVLMSIEGAGAKLVPVGPPNRYEEVAR